MIKANGYFLEGKVGRSLNVMGIVDVSFEEIPLNPNLLNKNDADSLDEFLI